MLAKEVLEDSILSHMSQDTPDLEFEDPKSQKVKLNSQLPLINHLLVINLP